MFIQIIQHTIYVKFVFIVVAYILSFYLCIEKQQRVHEINFKKMFSALNFI